MQFYYKIKYLRKLVFFGCICEIVRFRGGIFKYSRKLKFKKISPQNNQYYIIYHLLCIYFLYLKYAIRRQYLLTPH